MSSKLPISAIVATRDRSASCAQMLESLARQSVQPIEMVVVDGSTKDETRAICLSFIPQLATKIIHCKALQLGAAVQRNQALNLASQQTILFLDDDITFEPECIARLWRALDSDPGLGGVNAMIKNQQYTELGRVSRLLFCMLHGKSETSYAGKCIGPAFNLLPEDRPELPVVVPVEWLNTTCTLYRRKALPSPLFPSLFTGYSLMEDLTLSLMVGKKWKLANARTARIFHNSQPGDHKNDASELAKMELVNRHYVMTSILRRTKLSDYGKLAILQIFQIVSTATSSQKRNTLPSLLRGKAAAVREILIKRKKIYPEAVLIE